MLRHEDHQADDGAASEVDDVVDGDHLQIQHQLLGAFDRPGQDQGGAHVTGLLRYEEEEKRRERDEEEEEEEAGK